MSSAKQKKTLAYILKKFPVLSETFILNELLALESRGVPVHIFSLERPNDPRFHEDLPKLKARISYVPDMFDIHSLWRHASRASHSFGKSYVRTLRQVIINGKPSLLWRFLQGCYVANEARRYGVFHLHAHFATRPTTVACISSKISAIPFSFTAHAMDIFKTGLSKKSLSEKLKEARFAVAISEYNRQYLTAVNQGNGGKIVHIYNGINLERFRPNGTVRSSPFTFICVARLVEKKGHRILIEACEILHKRNISFECWIVGKGKLRSVVDRCIKEKNLGDSVKLLGPHSQDEVLDRYRQSQAYVLPCTVGSDGNRDGLPVSIVEALASGLPVITTPMTGNPEVVRSHHNGLLVPFNDPVALAEAMGRLIQDRWYYEHLKTNARSSVASVFDLTQTSARLLGLFEESRS